MQMKPLLVLVALSAGSLACGGAGSTSGASAPVSPTLVPPPVNTFPTASPAASPSAAGGSTQAMNAAAPTKAPDVPGFPPEAARHIELVSATAARIQGMDAYRLKLSKGSAWAIVGSPAVVVPRIRHDRSYNSNTSTFYRCGTYVLYFPDAWDTPDRFLKYLGPEPGMTLIDTDVDLSTQ